MMLTLAQREVSGGWSREVMEQFAKGSNIPLEVFAVIFGALALFLLIRGAFWAVRWARAKARPLLLFNRVAGRLGLASADRWWLWRVARRAELDSPITLLMSPATLEHYVNLLLGDQSRRGPITRRRMRQIGQRLFGDTTAE